MEIPERIHFLRTRRRNKRGEELSHDGYASLLGTSRQRVIAWEKGRAKPRKEYAEAIAKLERLPVGLFRDEREDRPLAVRVEALEAQMASLARAVGSLRSDLQERQLAAPGDSAYEQ